MRTGHIFALISSIFLAVAGGAAPGFAQQDFEVNIMTGGASGTYIQIGRDIATLAEATGRPVIAVESAGSLENLQAVRKRRLTQFGIVQSDVLDFIRAFRNEDRDMRALVRNTRMAFPLYNEEVHVVVRKSSGFESLADLSGKAVAVGLPDSGTNLTTTFLFEVAHVQPEYRLYLSAKESLDALRAGEIDAFVYVAGAPTKLLVDTSATDDLALLPATGSELSNYYGTSTVKAGTYPWLSADVTTYAVRAVLMTYDFNRTRNAYYTESCDAVSEISYLIYRNIETLREVGHPKWKQVDLDADVPGWERGACVEDALNGNYQPVYINTVQLAPEDCGELTNPIALQLCRMRNERIEARP